VAVIDASLPPIFQVPPVLPLIDTEPLAQKVVEPEAEIVGAIGELNNCVVTGSEVDVPQVLLTLTVMLLLVLTRILLLVEAVLHVFPVA
jgi:hypothetical protein